MEEIDDSMDLKTSPERTDLIESRASDNQTAVGKTRKKHKQRRTRTTKKERERRGLALRTETATVAHLGQNYSESPLLRLPREIRDRIMLQLFGEPFIHVQAYENYSDAQQKARLCDFTKGRTDAEEDALAKVRSQYLTHSVCRASQIEYEMYEIATCNVAPAPAPEPLKRKKAMMFCKDFNYRHRRCAMEWYEDYTKLMHDMSAARLPEIVSSVKEQRRRDQLDLTILRVCRQLYEEGTDFIWEKTTFSFNDSISFDKFMKSLDPSQNLRLERIHFSSSLSAYMESDVKYRWAPIIKQYRHMLQGLKVVNLSLKLEIAEKVTHNPKSSAVCFSPKWYLMKNIDHFISLRMHSPHTARVIVGGLEQNSSKERISFYQQISAEVEAKLLNKDKERTLQEEAAAMEVYYRHQDSERDQRDLQKISRRVISFGRQLQHAGNSLRRARQDSISTQVNFWTAQVEMLDFQLQRACSRAQGFANTTKQRLDEYAALRQTGDDSTGSKRIVMKKYVAFAKQAAAAKFPEPGSVR